MPIEIRYSSRRSEIWNWYWRSWRKGLWRVHLALTVAICAWAFALRGATAMDVALVRGLGMSALAIGAMVLFPQLMFKPSERTLVVDEDGVQTTIGRRVGSKSWKEISSVSEDEGYIVLTTTKKNAFVVPPRAFGSDDERASFLHFVQQAKATGSVGAA